MNNNDLKRQHEKAVAERLINSLSLEDFVFNKLGNDNGEPDVIYRNKNKTIGIEIRSAYLGEGYAMSLWGVARGNMNYLNKRSDIIVSSTALSVQSIQESLDDKAHKKYSGVDDVWYCIEPQSPFQVKDADLSNLVIKENYFNHIYILCYAPTRDGVGKDKTYRLK